MAAGRRRADVFVPHVNTVLEVQHSYIDPVEVKARHKDYVGIEKKRLVWLVDGSRGVRVQRLQLTDSLLLLFGQDDSNITFSGRWMFESFQGMGGEGHVYMSLPIEGGEEIVRFRPDDVRSGMVEARSGGVRPASFCEALVKGSSEGEEDPLEKLYAFDDTPLPQCKLYLKQRGAGCGKTYESVRLAMRSPAGVGKTCYVYLTKQHTAKDVIYKEFLDQAAKLDPSAGVTVNSGGSCGRQHRLTIQFRRPSHVDAEEQAQKDGQESVEVVIGTLDSFFYAMGDKTAAKHLPGDYFSNLRQSIREGHRGYDRYGRTRYGKGSIGLDRRCMVIVDEAQDLPPEYVETLGVIQRGTHADLYVIGDKLQSIWGCANVFTMLNEAQLPHAVIEFDCGSNVVRRFKRPGLMRRVNAVVPFERCGLPPIQAVGGGEYFRDDTDNIAEAIEDEDCVRVFPQQAITKKTPMDTQMVLVRNLLQTVDSEARRRDLLPHDFMFIFPVMKNNALAFHLETAIQQYWGDRFLHDGDLRKRVLQQHAPYWAERIASYDPEFYNHAMLHTSDEGKPINLNESKWATSLLSIHASKGQGREIVFFLNAYENALKIYSSGKADLQFESLLHVAMTRQKWKLFVGVSTDPSDDVRKRLLSSSSGVSSVDSDDAGNMRKPSLSINDILHYVTGAGTSSSWFGRLYEAYLRPIVEDLQRADADKQREYDGSVGTREGRSDAIIDWGHHVMRAVVLRYGIIRNILSSSHDQQQPSHLCPVAKQIIVILSKVARAPLEKLNVTAYHRRLTDLSRSSIRENDDSDPPLPVLEYAHDTHSNLSGRRYCDVLCYIMRGVQKRLKEHGLGSSSPEQMNTLVSLPEMCPLESLVFEHFVQVFEHGKYAPIAAPRVYDMLHAVHSNQSAVEVCCPNVRKALDRMGPPPPGCVDGQAGDEIRQSLVVHYGALQRVSALYRDFLRHLREDLADLTPLTFNIDHVIKFEGRRVDRFKVWASVPFVATTSRNVVLLYVRPTFNLLNRQSILLEALFGSFIARNPPEGSRNHERFGCNTAGGTPRKTVHACVVSLTMDRPVWVRLGDDIPEDPTVRMVLRDAMLDTKLEYTNRYLSTFFQRAIEQQQKQSGVISDDGDVVKGAIESTRQAVSDASTDAPEYLMEAVNRADELEDDGDRERALRALSQDDLERCSRRRVNKWLVLTR